MNILENIQIFISASFEVVSKKVSLPSILFWSEPSILSTLYNYLGRLAGLYPYVAPRLILPLPNPLPLGGLFVIDIPGRFVLLGNT